MKTTVIFTTIYEPSKITDEIIKVSKSKGFEVIVAGDVNTPSSWEKIPDILYIPYTKGVKNSYARKNQAYTLVNDSDIIVDIDDDNSPYFYRWGDIPVGKKILYHETGFINILDHFTFLYDVWNRGVPLSFVRNRGSILREKVPIDSTNVVIWQCLIDGDSDVDSICRLTRNVDSDMCFSGEPVILAKGTFSPFNSQNTIFLREAFPLLYIPCTVNMRIADILRSVVAQVILWSYDLHVGFSFPTVYHERHEHDLLEDFEMEYPFYNRIPRIITELKKVPVHNNMKIYLRDCYWTLDKLGYTNNECYQVERWLDECLFW